jgi:hypothetical protein
MAKVQGKKIAASARRARGKVTARVKTAARAIKKKVAKPAARIKPKKVTRTAKPAPSKPLKAVKKAAAALPARPAAVRPVAPKTPVAARVPPAPAPPKKTRARRPRPRIQSNGAPVAAWLPPGAQKPRPSSFIPAPPRAEAPSLIAAPPASSDRLIRPEDVTEFVTRTVPVRVDVEATGGRVYISVNPEEVVLRSGEGIEWDFRYIGGADVTVDELLVEFDKPSPFSQSTFRSHKPGTARPHRQLSGAVHSSSAGKTIRYAIKAMTPFKTELAVARPVVTIQT